MTSAKHFFAFLPSGEADPVRVSQLHDAFSRLGYQVMRGDSYLAGFVPFADQNRANPAGLASWHEVIVHVLPGTEIGIRSELGRLGDDAAAIRSLAADTIRLFNLLICEQDSIRVVSDPLCLLPYYRIELGQHTLVCSSIRHLFAACPYIDQEIDSQGVFEFFCCGTPLGRRTLHKHVRISQPGQVVRWRRKEGLQIDRSERLIPLPANAALAAPVAADQIANYVRESLGKLRSPALLTLTGGFDSRLIACFAASLQLNPRMVTLGYMQHDEIRVAQAVATILGSRTTVFPPPHPDVLELLPVWLDCLEGLADGHMLFMANLLSFPADEGMPLYHGFIGDTLSGALLNWIPIEAATQPEEIARGAVEHFFREISPQAAAVLQLDASIEKAVEDIQAEFVTGLSPHQTFTLWNLENIQRRLVGHQLLYLGQRFMPAPVFYYRPLMDLWLSVPRMALDNRNLLRFIFEKHFPKVASLPHAEHVPSMIPRSKPAMRYVGGWISRRYRARILRSLKLNAEKMEAASYIWALWHGTTPQQRETELQRLDKTFGLFSSRMGWQAPSPQDSLWQACTSLERKQLLMLRRMYLLGEYVESLPQGTAAASAPSRLN